LGIIYYVGNAPLAVARWLESNPVPERDAAGGDFMKKIRITGLLIERTGIQEMAIASSKKDAELAGIDIAVFSNEHPPRHATILKRNNHRISLGWFEITADPPMFFTQVKEVKEPIESEYKKQITKWAAEISSVSPYPINNWELLKTLWNSLNPRFAQK
jgi:hypothetical protein